MVIHSFKIIKTSCLFIFDALHNKKTKVLHQLKFKGLKMHFKKSIIALTLASTLAACGSGDSDDYIPTTSKKLVLVGAVSKGLILGGVVAAYLINDDGTKGTPVGSAITDTDDGTYELTLDAGYNGKALIIEITDADGSQMKCDLTVCRDGDTAEEKITFGERYPLPSDFKLSAVSSGSDSGTIDINITPLTNIAAALTLDNVAKNKAKPTDAAAAANNQVADRFGLPGDVTELPIVDLTNADDIKSADANALEANLISAAIVEAALNDSDEGTSLESALGNFVEQYIDSDGIADTEGEGVDTEAVSLEEILAASKDLKSTVVAEVDGVNANDNNIAAVEAALITAEKKAAEGSTDKEQGDIGDDVGALGLIATKFFVKQLSTLTKASEIDKELKEGKAFEEQVSLASDLASDDLLACSRATTLATDAIAHAVTAYYKDKSIKTFVYLSLYGPITVAITANSNDVAYTVENQPFSYTDSTGETIVAKGNLTAVITKYDNNIIKTGQEQYDQYTHDNDANNIWTEKGEASLDLALSGSVSTENLIMTIKEGSHFVATLSVDFEEKDVYSNPEPTSTLGGYSQTNAHTGTDFYSIKVTDLDAKLLTTIKQSGVWTDPVTFEGEFSIIAHSLESDKKDVHNETHATTVSQVYSKETATKDRTEQSDHSTTDTETETLNIDGLTASLSGTFTNSKNSLKASVAIVSSGIAQTCQRGYESSFSYTSLNYSTIDSSHTYNEYENCNLDETAETYASASINVRMILTLNGIDDDINLEASIQRTDLEDGIASIDLTYGGNELGFAFDSVDGLVETEDDTTKTTTITATLTDHNGVTLTTTYVDIDNKINMDHVDTITGIITQKGEKFATVSNEGLVTFSDGTFVSL